MKIRKRWCATSKSGLYGWPKKTVRAHTKSEARAVFKAVLRMNPKNRLPSDIVVSEVNSERNPT